MNAYDSFDTPFGPFSVAVNEDGAVLATALDQPEHLAVYRLPLSGMVHDPERVAHVHEQLDEYFAGERLQFDLRLAAAGTPYQHRVWQKLVEIPLGETRSYRQLAIELDSGPRAVGSANGANPICLIVPCHRVIGADGSLTGFAYGIDLKRRLLEHEAGVVAKQLVLA
jgi:methylated-DNA-[protein]-cysteine S-methyltransferase